MHTSPPLLSQFITSDKRRALAAAESARLKIVREQQARAEKLDAERNRLLLLHMADRWGYYFLAFCIGASVMALIGRLA